MGKRRYTNRNQVLIHQVKQLGQFYLPVLSIIIGQWHLTQALYRQAILFKPGERPRQNWLVEAKVAGFQELLPRLLEVEPKTGRVLRDNLALRISDDKLLFIAEGLSKGPRLFLLYWAPKGSGWRNPPLDPSKGRTGDYATDTYGDAWNFDEGDQEGISQWGDKPTEYGEVKVENGCLLIPITGNDPYFIWGVMWGEPKGRHIVRIDSGCYRYLKMQVWQSVPKAMWSVYFTDTEGTWQVHHFTVKEGWQTIILDLRKVFPNFWDGRTMRALRIDPTNFCPGALVKVDWVRIEQPPSQVVVGLVLSRDCVAARKKEPNIVARTRPSRPKVGKTLTVWLKAVTDQSNPLANLLVAVQFGEKRKVAFTSQLGEAMLSFPAGKRAGAKRLVWGAADDLGHPVKFGEKPIKVKGGPLIAYELAPEREFVSVDWAWITVAIYGLDEFGNRLPVNIRRPRWSVTNGGEISPGPLQGFPARVRFRGSKSPLTIHEVTLADERGCKGRTTVTMVNYRKRYVKLFPSGYLAFSDGQPFVPLGGFYANWPAIVEEKEERLRGYDLFPCGPKPYQAGFPWSPEVERMVRRWLEFCAKSGVTSLRLMLRNMDIVGEVDKLQLQAVNHLFEIARPLGIYFDVVLFEDYDKPPYVNPTILENIVLPKYKERDLSKLPSYRRRFLVERRVALDAREKYTDPEIIACQKDYLRSLIPHLAAEPQVFCYELENEMVNPPMSWVNEMTGFIKRLDPHTLVLGNPGPHEHPVPLLWRESKVDLFSYHPYNDGLPFVDHGAVVYTRSKWAAMSGKPMFTGEGGINQNRWQKGVKKVPPEFAVRGVRDQIWLTLTNGECGAFLWAPELKGEVYEFGKAKEVVTKLNLRTLERSRPKVGIVIPAVGGYTLCFKWAWSMLSKGLDFDFLTEPNPRYEVCSKIDVPTEEGKLPLPESPLRPMEGYQLSSLVSRDGSQILVYLRNVAGGIRDLGDGRPCYLRVPSPTDAGLTLSLDGEYEALTYNLDEGKWLPKRKVSGKGLLLVAKHTTHDFVLVLKSLPTP